jgi:hypothetical protein
MPVTFAHILGILVCLFALGREYPEAMAALREY